MTRKILFVVYRSLITLVFPFLILYVLWRCGKDRRYLRNLVERFGWLRLNRTRPGVTPFHRIPGGIWIHAVSVGEVMLVPAIAESLRRRWPERPVFVSVTTIAGRELAEKRLAGIADALFHAPLDAAWIVRRVLRQLRPASVIILETEIWPNLWRESKRFGASLYVMNGRISDKAMPTYRRWRSALRHVLQLPDAILTQSAGDRERYRELGALSPIDCGNLKFDFRPPTAPAPEIAAWAAGKRLFIAASTMPPDEVDTVIRAYLKMPPDVRMLLAPRKPELFQQAADKLAAAGIRFTRRSAGPLDSTAPVLLLDTIGELAACFALPSAVFIGGSLVTWGGHNLLEPASFGRPIITGPHMHNFAATARDFREVQAVLTVTDADSLAETVRDLLGDTSRAEALGRRARLLAETQRGATERCVSHMTLGAPLTHRPFPAFWQTLSWLWRAGVAVDRLTTRKTRLSRPVISIGGLAMGGAGKTPFTLWLIEALAAQGLRPAVLLRGYGRRDRRTRVYPPGTQAPVDETGDETQLYLHQNIAWVGVGANRAEAAAGIGSQADVFLLDDGFQHWRLHRDFDVVLIDELDPHAGGGVFPAGLLREPHSALARANAVVVLRKRAKPSIPAGLWPAFCGIGNPGSFLATLRAAGVEVSRFVELPDHEPALPREVSQSGEQWLTTGKDAARFPQFAQRFRAVEIDVQFDGQAELLARILAVCRPPPAQPTPDTFDASADSDRRSL